MAFQFLCPQGHLLQAEPWQVGQQSMCPYCRSVFLVPAPPGGAPGGLGWSGGTSPGGLAGGGGQLGAPPGIWPGTMAPTDAPPSVAGGSGMGGWPGMAETEATSFPSGPPQEGFSVMSPPTPASEETPWSPGPQEAGESESPIISTGPTVISPTETPLLHILCPSGHELETPRQMLGQEAMCPFCQVQFRLRWEDSLEYRKEKELELERRMARQSKLWMQWSIAAAVAVVIGLIVMIVIAASH